MIDVKSRFDELKQAAIGASKYAHAPYSKFALGSAILTSSEKIFSGANMENSSFGATVCAERVAIWKSQSEERSRVLAVFVYIEAADPWPPCGMCRQVLSEFGEPTTILVTFNHLGKQKMWTFAELFPASFGVEYLP